MNDSILSEKITFRPRYGETAFGAPLIGVFSLVFSLTLFVIWQVTGGSVLYSLDDPYIHLALAEGLAQGHYGINPGEVASPSSSILYPLILVPFVHLGIGHAAPLALNTIFTVAFLLVLARFISCMGISSSGAPLWVRLGVALALVLGLNLVGLVFTGLEHSLHVLVTVASLFGLLLFLRDGRIPVWWMASLVLLPLVRFEGCALLVGCLAALAWRGRLLPATGIATAVVVLLAIFAVTMRALGLPMLPSSVLAKAPSAASDAGILAIPMSVVKTVLSNLSERAGLLLLAGILALMGVLALGRCRFGDGRQVEIGIAGVCTFALLAHLAFGKMGWFERYEIYALVIALSGVAVVARQPLAQGLRHCRPTVAWLAILGFLAVMVPYARATVVTPIAVASVYAQQYQMHRFVTEFYHGPVAVNDLGWVAYRNENQVLDLWGLGSEDARQARMSDASQPDPNAAWIDRLVSDKHIDLAMVYDHWFPFLPKSWQKLGSLDVGIPLIVAGGSRVTFYATRPDAAVDLREKLKAFSRTLPPFSRMVGLDVPLVNPRENRP